MSRDNQNDGDDNNFGSWTVLEKHGSMWKCQCVCGTIKDVRSRTLIGKHSKSCGCTRPKGSQWTIEQVRASKRKHRRKAGYRAKESKRWRMADPKRYKSRNRDHHYRTKYNLTVAQAEAILVWQGGRCAICASVVSLGGKCGARVDHCHGSGKVRGVLCNGCNVGLGHFKENQASLLAAVSYLNRSR